MELEQKKYVKVQVWCEINLSSQVDCDALTGKTVKAGSEMLPFTSLVRQNFIIILVSMIRVSVR